MDRIQLLNTYVNNVTMCEALDSIDNMIKSGKKSYIVMVNVDVIIKIEKDKKLKSITDNADMVLVDGKPLVWISKWHRKPVKAKISGSDLVPELFNVAVKNKYSIFILGGKEGIGAMAKQNAEIKFPGINIVGTYAPPFEFEKNDKEIDKINDIIMAKKPDLLIVCFGCPKQEKWIYDNYQKYNAKVSICAGATVDFLAGNIKRCPEWMSNHGLEWLYRFFKEPTRLFKRYFVDDVKILKLVWKYRNSSKIFNN